ncbi:MAG: L,D-transpeptidase family protein [Aeromonadaceae bacterium]
MFGKVVKVTMLSLLGVSLSGIAGAVGEALQQAPSSAESSLGVTQSIPLPSEAIRSELAQQLLELALADVHPAINHLWLALSKSRDPQVQSQLFAETFILLKQFRTQWHQLSWDDRERIQLKNIKFASSAQLLQEYVQALKSGGLAQEVAKLQPARPDYQALRHQLSWLLDMAREGEWSRPGNFVLHPGESHAQLPQVKQLLMRLKLSAAPLPSDELYDPETVAAVEAFQRLHGLQPDGVIGPRTLAWMRITPAQKAVILARSLLRSDVGDRLDQGRLVLVNIPEYQLRVLEGQQQIFTSRVIVGKLQRQTPILDSKIASVVLNPAWHVPTTILKQDIVPKLARDPHYLAKERFDIYDYSGTKIDPSTIAWPQALDAGFPYKLKQQPGDHNALGRYKFYLPNDESIYLHSTANPRLFKLDQRAISSGCVRVEMAADFANLLLQGSSWSAEKISKTLAAADTKWVPLSAPVPVFTVYWRSWLDDKGQLQFRDDIYGFDTKALANNSAVLDSVLQVVKS